METSLGGHLVIKLQAHAEWMTADIVCLVAEDELKNLESIRRIHRVTGHMNLPNFKHT